MCGISQAEAEKRQAAELKLCQSDFRHWIRNHGWVADPKNPDPTLRKIPLLLWPEQERLCDFLLEGAADGLDRLVNKSREIGATWIACHVLHWLAWTQQGFSALAMSRVEDLVDDKTPASIFGKIRFVHSMQPVFLRPEFLIDSYMRIVYRFTESVLLGESTNAGAGRSTRHTVVLCDEWAHVDFHKQRPIALALESVARSRWLISTPNGRGDDFYMTWSAAPARNKLEISWRADPRRTEEWFLSLLRENGGRLTWDEREQEYNCSFAGVSGLRIFKFDRARTTYGAETRAEVAAMPGLFTLGAMDFGSGPSWTVLLLARILLPDGGEKFPRLWIGAELVAQRMHAQQIADRGLALLREFPLDPEIVGDPAGRAKDSKQESWESNLQAGGLPLLCLPSTYNEPDVITQTLEEGQAMLDQGRVLIDAERCPVLVEALESWEWDLPAGLSIELVNRKMISPKKNAWSHLGDAFRYLVGKAMRTPPRPKVTREQMYGAVQPEPQGVMGLEDVFDRVLGAGYR